MMALWVIKQLSPIYHQFQVSVSMSSIGLSGISGISENTLQFRYQKALKQINKLIEINRKLKETTNQQETQIDQLMQQLQALQQENNQLDQQNNILESKYMELEGHCHQLEAFCKQVTDKFKINQIDEQQFQDKMRETEAKYHQELQNEVVKYNELARQAELINQVYQENLSALELNQQKIKELQSQNSQLQLKSNRLAEENQNLSKERNIEHIKNQLDQANKTIEKLVKECNELKNKQIDQEAMDEKKRVEKDLGLAAFNDPRQNEAIKHLISEYKKRIKQLETDKKEIERKYKKLKSHSAQLYPDEAYQRKIYGLEQLTEKQQAEIGKIIQTYDQELNTLAFDNKKLRENYISLSQQLTKKSVDLEERDKYIAQLKFTAERIQIENESLKKANSLFSEGSNQKFKQIRKINKDIEHAQSFTIIEKKSADQLLLNQDNSINMKKKQQNEAKNESTNPSVKTPKANPQIKHIPITLNYTNSPDPGDFKFIQSVNIINGYNVNLGEPTNSKQSKQRK